MNKITVGCDVSKDTLDFFCINTDEHFVLPNNEAGMKKFIRWMKQHKFEIEQLSLAFENTGAYSSFLVKFCDANGITFYQIPPLQLKRSLGLTRGKNDKIDAQRIAVYLQEKEYKLTPSKAPSPIVEEIMRLRTQRSLLVRQRTAHKNNLRVFRDVRKLKATDLSVKIAMTQIQDLDNYIEQIEKKIESLLVNEKEMNDNYNLLQTIKGIGPVTALMFIVETANFTRFPSWRSLACYCGCAPFENSSGKFQSNKKVSHFARKEMKATLTRAARSAAKNDPILKKYMARKLQEGKVENLIINNIRCKMIATAYAVIRDQRAYKINYSQNLAA